MNEWINECPRLFLSLIRIAKSSQINKIKTDKRSSFTRVPSILDDGMFVNSMRSETIYGVFCFKWKTWENIFLHWKSKEIPHNITVYIVVDHHHHHQFISQNDALDNLDVFFFFFRFCFCFDKKIDGHGHR